MLRSSDTHYTAQKYLEHESIHANCQLSMLRGEGQANEEPLQGFDVTNLAIVTHVQVIISI